MARKISKKTSKSEKVMAIKPAASMSEIKKSKIMAAWRGGVSGEMAGIGMAAAKK